MEKYDFIKLMLQNRNLSLNDKKRLVLLATREIEKEDNLVEGAKHNNGTENDINYIQFNTDATNLVEGFKSVTYVADKAEQFLPQKHLIRRKL